MITAIDKKTECFDLPIPRGRGFGSGSHKEFIRFLTYAHRSVLEVQSHLYIALDRNYIDQKDFDSIFELTMSCKKLINGFKRYLSSDVK